MFARRCRRCVCAFVVSYVIFVTTDFLFTNVLGLTSSRGTGSEDGGVFTCVAFLPFSRVVIITVTLFAGSNSCDKTGSARGTAGVTVCVFLLVVVLFSYSFPFIVRCFRGVRRRGVVNRQRVLHGGVSCGRVVVLGSRGRECEGVGRSFTGVATATTNLVRVKGPRGTLHILAGAGSSVAGVSRFSVYSGSTMGAAVCLGGRRTRGLNIGLGTRVSRDCPVVTSSCSVYQVLFGVTSGSITTTTGLRGGEATSVGVRMARSRVVFRDGGNGPGNRRGGLRGGTSRRNCNVGVVNRVTTGCNNGCRRGVRGKVCCAGAALGGGTPGRRGSWGDGYTPSRVVAAIRDG